MTDVEIIDILNKYNRFLNEKCELLNNKVLNNYLEEFTINNFNNCSQCKALTWNNGRPKQCCHKSTIGHFCKIHSKIETKECKHCFTHYKKKVRHSYKWQCIGTIDFIEDNSDIESYIKNEFDKLSESEYDTTEYDDLLKRITSNFTQTHISDIRNALDDYIQSRE